MAGYGPLVSVFDQNAKFAAIDGLVNCQIPHEEELLQSLRERVGPHASEQRLLYHLRANRGRVHWASNSYLREAVSCLSSGPADFEAKPNFSASLPSPCATSALDCHPGSSTRSACSTVPDGVCLSSIPCAMLEAILSNCNLTTVCQAAMVSKSFNQAASSDVVWHALYLRRWGTLCAAVPMAAHGHLSCTPHLLVLPPGSAAPGSVEPTPPAAESPADTTTPRNPTGSSPCPGGPVDSRVPSPPAAALSWKSRYQKRHGEEREMRCPCCGHLRLVPVVYGFPSSPLVAAMHRQRVVLGGDYLVETEPSWSCTACDGKFMLYPYRCRA